MNTLLIHNIGWLATPRGNGPLRGQAMQRVQIQKKAAILMQDGIIQAITSDGALPGHLPDDTRAIDAGGRLVTPGLIDPHTHLVFGGYRQHEVWRRVRGDDYLDILRAGGGILDTVRHTRAADFETLYKKSYGFVREMLARGVTTCEAKSGYGLDIDTEKKQLDVARVLHERTPMDIVNTYLGAHAVPPEYEGHTDAYVQFLIDSAIPAIAAEHLAEYCDVFCEQGIFDIEQSRKILECAKAHGMGIKLHADEMASSGGGTLAAEMNATSADHLIAVSVASLYQLARSETVAVLLPQTSLYLDKAYAPGRRMIELNIPVALATDFNPGSCPSNNLHLSMNLAFLKYGFSPEEVLSAVTQNAACALGLGTKIGTLEPGKHGDVVLWDAEDLTMLCYRMGANLVHRVIKRGTLLDV